MTKVLILN